MDAIKTWKERGNEFFKLKDYLKAINCYEEALQLAKNIESDVQSMLQKDSHANVPRDQLMTRLKEVENVKTQLNGNLSLGHLKRNEIDEAEFYNGFVLDSDPKNVKAHFRIIQMLIARKELIEAQQFAIKCTSMFKEPADQKTFKDVLLNEIGPKIKEKSQAKDLEQELIDIEQKLNNLV